jgi:hypothetical protein
MRSGLILILLLIVNICKGQDDSIANRIVLIGDAGDILSGRQPVIDAVRRTIPMDKKTTVLFLGDNLYSIGLPDEQYSSYNGLRSVLDTQVSLVKNTQAKAYFIPGNHDWANGAPQGYEQIIRQQHYIDRISSNNVKFYPEDGCPGPVEVKISKDVILIIMDSQWWLNRHEKPGIESDCPYKTEDEVITQIGDIIENNAHKLILFACHHPFRSTGVHSGYYGIKQHIFPFTDLNKNAYIPLPLIGSIYPISRGVFGSPQDMKYPAYVNMVSRVEDELKKHPYVIHLHGHEHTLQFIQDSSYNYIVSGAGCKMARVAHSKKTKFAARSLGFAVLDISKNKTVHLTFYEVPLLTPDTVTKPFSENILDFSKFPEIVADTATVHNYVFKDSISVPVNTKYAQASSFKRALFGDNYRTEWATPVKLKVFDINNEKGGLKITALGGGKQSRSLQLEDKHGKKWVLRSINKNPINAMPANFRIGMTADIVQDMISASHPYGALVVPKLCEAVNVTCSKPEYFLVPNDYALGLYRPVFANTVCMLEAVNPTPDNADTKSTFKVFNKKLEDHEVKVDQKNLLSARMIDFLIADFDRHYDQWKWATRKDTKLYYPIPKDRDQALFYSDGLVMKYVTRKSMPFLRGLRYNMPQSNWLGYVARDIDRTYINELNEQDWQQTLQEFKNKVNDNVIDNAVHDLPPEIYAIDGKVITEKLKSRRDLIPEKGMLYYKFISHKVNVLGSNEDEYFHISNAGKGIVINVYGREKNGDTSILMYRRQFDPRITKEVRMYGFNGNDVFKVDDDVASRIRLRMIGGQGNDSFDIKGRINNYIYDLSTEENPIIARNRTKKMFSPEPSVNAFVGHNSPEYNFPMFTFPAINLGYNLEDGIMAGLGVAYRTYGFRKLPYASDQHLSTLFSFAQKAYQVKYTGEFIHFFRNYDLLIHGIHKNPALDNFFGFGNDTKKDPNTPFHYYRARYKYIEGDVLLSSRPLNNKLLSISLGPTGYYYWNRYSDNSDRILAHPGLIGLDSASVYNRKSYAGGKLSINVNNVNNELFPTRGVDWTTDFTSMTGLNANSQPITKFQSDMTVYASLTDPAKVVAVLRIGGGRIFSEHFEYFQALSLGANNYLRGFRKDRFSGRGSFYTSIELRVKLLDVNSYVLPGSLGIVGFNDIGRVWMSNEDSRTWHDGYGGGLYYTPFNYVMIAATVALSGEEALPNFTIGSKINLTY